MDVSYVRNSVEKLQKNSIEMQRTMNKEKAKLRSIVISKEYIDQDVSARKTELKERPGLTQLLEDVKSGKVKRIIVYRRDRLARKAAQYIEIYLLLMEYAVEIIFSCQEEPPIIPGRYGKYFEYLLAGLIEVEGNNIASRIRSTKMSNFMAGKWLGNLPFGFKYDDKKVVQRVAKEIAVVKIIFNSYFNKTSLRHIVKELNGREDTLFRGKKWDTIKVLSIIDNITYMGVRTFSNGNEDCIRQDFEVLRVIEPNIWLSCQKRRNKERRTVDKNVYRAPFLLSEKLVCLECNKPLLIKSQKDSKGTIKQKYICPNKDEHFDSKKRVIDKDEIELQIQSDIEVYLQIVGLEFFDNILTQYIKTNSTLIQAAINDNKRQIKTCQSRRARLVNKILSLKNGTSEYDKRKREVEQNEVEYERLNKTVENLLLKLDRIQELASRSGMLLDIVRNKRIRLQELTDEEKLLVVEGIIEQARTDGKQVEINYKFPFGKSWNVIEPKLEKVMGIRTQPMHSGSQKAKYDLSWG